MIDLEKFPEYLDSLSIADWERLFMLIPEIEETKEFGKLRDMDTLPNGGLTMPYWEESSLVPTVQNVILDLKLTPVFDWIGWDYGKEIVMQKDHEIPELDNLTLCKLLTVILRADRFNDGFLLLNFENGTMLKILQNLQRNYEKKKHVSI
jgi:hypothetical protein